MKKGENNHIEILSTGFRLQQAGTYDAVVSCSFTCDVNNTIVHAGIFANDTLYKRTQMEEKIGTAGDHGVMPMSGFGVGKESTKITLQFTADKACTITINHLDFKIVRIK